MFTFAISAVRKVIARGEADAAANGGFRNPYFGDRSSEREKPGFWLVGDEGVYVMSNGKLTEGKRPLVVYAGECDPKANSDWWDYKRQHFGGDDGVEFIDADLLIQVLTGNPRPLISAYSLPRTTSRSR